MVRGNSTMRILIATVTAGAGHLQAAAALEEAWKAWRPVDEVVRVDLLDFVPKLQKKVYSEGYVKFVGHAPELWGMVFKKTDKPALWQKLSSLRRNFAKQTNRKFVKYLKEFAPDMVLSTHFQPPEILGGLKFEAGEKKPFLGCVVTDFEAHALWMEPSVDFYCVAAEDTRKSLVARGVAAEKIAVTGIPIGLRFGKKIDAAVVRKSLGIRDDLPVVLVLGGGFGMGPVAEILKQINEVKTAVQVLVVAGRNEELRRELAVQEHKHPTRIFGFVTNMHELMAVSALIVSKPGGLTTSEALALGKPLFILNPIPGQEAANSDFLLEHGAATKVNRAEDVAFRIDELLSGKRLDEMSAQALKLGKTEAAKQACVVMYENYLKAQKA